jgi:hypothetical protein
MIQRIQSIYLALAALILTLLFFLPFSTASLLESGVYTDGKFNIYDNLIILISDVIITITGIITIFLYNNRKLQLKLSSFSILLNISILILCLIIIFGNKNSPNLNYGLLIPVFSSLLFYLAYRGIKSDEELVKSSNRLR